MANKNAILDKLSRNLDQLSISNTRGSSSVTADSLVISYVDASIQSPMGGISDASSPFLGIGVQNPGKLKIKGAAGQNTIAAIFTSQARLQILKAVGDFGNNVVVEAGDSSSQLAEIKAHSDLLGMGQ